MTSANALPRMVLLAVVVAAFLLLASSVGEAGQGGETPVATRTYMVRSGDTLWSLATDLTPAGGDVRRTVFELRRLNGLEDSRLLPGQRLRIPAGH